MCTSLREGHLGSLRVEQLIDPAKRQVDAGHPCLAVELERDLGPRFGALGRSARRRIGGFVRDDQRQRRDARVQGCRSRQPAPVGPSRLAADD